MAGMLRDALVRPSLVLPALHLALRLDGGRHSLHALGDRGLRLVGAVVLAGHPAQCQDVGAGHPQHGELGELLGAGVGGHGPAQGLVRRGDGVDSGALPGIGLDAALPGHVLVVPLLMLVRVLWGLVGYVALVLVAEAQAEVLQGRGRRSLRHLLLQRLLHSLRLPTQLSLRLEFAVWCGGGLPSGDQSQGLQLLRVGANVLCSVVTPGWRTKTCAGFGMASGCAGSCKRIEEAAVGRTRGGESTAGGVSTTAESADDV